jgi:hypothetical protein
MIVLGGYSQDTIVKISPPLNEEEKRQVIELLKKFEALTISQDTQLKACEDNVGKLNDVGERERKNYEVSLENAREKISLEKERADMEKARGDLYEKLFKDVTKKRNGFGCFLKRLFTLGRARCV